jgi:hypothetical protein
MTKQSDDNLIWCAIHDRFNEALNKKNWNGAYEVAFNVGIHCDIERALKGIKERVRRDAYRDVLDRIEVQADEPTLSNTDILSDIINYLKGELEREE